MSVMEVMLLLNKFKNGQISQEELLRLKAMVAQGDYGVNIKEDILTSLYSDLPDSGWKKEDADKILQVILQSAEQPVSPLYTTHNRKKWYLAAAILLGATLLIGSLYLVQKKHAAPLTLKQIPLSPGSNKALLTLADGSTMPLDSSNLGALAQQGNIRVVNTAQGLTYTSAGTTEKVVYNTVATPRGGQYQLTLSDGSRVYLNAASSIRFPTAFTGKERLVEITGESYFQVAANAQMPFKVKVAGTSGMEVKVLGTSFNIMAYPDEQMMTTTLEEGTVKLVYGNSQSLLKPGFSGSLSPENKKFVVEKADMAQALAWKEGKFRFRNTGIQTIMRQLARWYNVEIDYEGDLSDIRLTGIISRRENAAALLKILATTKRVHFDITGNRITVKPADLP
jgi:transmembrane sensor